METSATHNQGHALLWSPRYGEDQLDHTTNSTRQLEKDVKRFFLRKGKWVVTSSDRQKLSMPTLCKLMRAEKRRLEMKENEVKVEGDVFVQMTGACETLRSC